MMTAEEQRAARNSWLARPSRIASYRIVSCRVVQKTIDSKLKSRQEPSRSGELCSFFLFL